MKESDYGKYTEFKIEKDVIAITAYVLSFLSDLPDALLTSQVLCSKAKRSVIHFFHRDFRRCKIMDQHLEVRLFFPPSFLLLFTFL